ncbi:hypothetical protein SECTIM467_73 [Brevibacillus phage SecTim467]|uniref:Uncharacterized protein n=2 Tax=Jenstvirus jenst TaxID=1982225 RepID=A0A0K2CNX0_9CAUD|nr:hypothetical protein AVV11_gp123 [Brevibacillus phage Jenst]ALA07197.1 hypothetical protein JENST_68 [Brevibacillus phage Jenst]ALA07418.1 hypothetical protein SECTIM467_73 [Brevibacillus phage SecTim467]
MPYRTIKTIVCIQCGNHEDEVDIQETLDAKGDIEYFCRQCFYGEQ